LEQSHNVSKNPNYHNQVAAIKGGLMYKKKQWSDAEEELSKLLTEVDSTSLKSPLDKIALEGFLQLAKLKLQKGDYKKSISIGNQRLKGKLGFEHKKEFYGVLAANHQALGEYGIANKYFMQRDAVRDTIARFYEGTLRLSKEQEMLDQLKVREIETLKYKNELSQIEAAQQRNLISIGGILALLVSGMLYLWTGQSSFYI